MFELSKDVMDDIIFAMEDQDGAWQVDLATGGLIEREVACGDGETLALPRPETVSVPAWSPREGFKMMETFAAGQRNPAVRRALLEALGQGRGVFKAFKERLAEHAGVERSFRDTKARIMGARIREWYDDLREAAGLERLGDVPEDETDLIESDLGFSTGLASACRPFMAGLLERLEEEAGAELPAPLVARELRRLRALLDREDWVGVWVEDGEGGAFAGASGIRESGPGYEVGRIFFVAVDPGFRRQGLARSLVERLAKELCPGEDSPILIDCTLVPPVFEKGLLELGFTGFGARAWRGS